ncbi:GNAT family N-acetyltransferase [uncultured Microbulbifer sp.]|uniref:GNAT family N-acetyltransferase n=1 Tax=uncultured Microbulbifer sp. TaxID=348147 RepID=UPI0025EC6FC3|nr:GNAT family N-acetyltransferase [uncultured Microbulbifer sp.]
MSEDQHHEALTRTVTEKLRNGRVVTIRPMRREDIELEREFISNLSQESRHQRFLGGVGKPSEQLMRQLMDVDHDKREAFIALFDEDGTEKEVGVSRYALDADGKGAECAVVVADDWQVQGLGTLLLKRVVESAKSRGIELLYSTESASNNKLREVAEHMGWDCRTDPRDATQVIYSLKVFPRSR